MAKSKSIKYESISRMLTPVFVISFFISIVIVFVATPLSSLNVFAGRDSTAPIVSFVGLEDGSIIGDGETRLRHVLITARFEDDNLDNRAYLRVNGVEFGMGNYNRADSTFSVPIFMPDFENGEYLLEAYAADKRGNVGSSLITVQFNNGPKIDFEGPNISINNITEGTVFNRGEQYPVNYTVSDSSGVNRVHIQVLQKDKRTGNWTWGEECLDYTGNNTGVCYFWAQKSYTGDVIVRADAYDWDGNKSTTELTAVIK